MEMLLDEELEKVVGTIIINGDKKYVQSASYDIRVGNEIYFPERGERKEIKTGDVEHLQPFESALIKTIEEIKLPKNMVGLMQPSSKLSTCGLIYTGGSIDPGYEGCLWVSIRNMAPRYEEIEFGQPIASIHLIKFEKGKEVIKGYAEEHGRIDTLSKDRRPPMPERTLYDWIKISSKLDEVGTEVSTVKVSVEHVNNLVNGAIYGVLYATIAGIIAGLVIVIVQFLLKGGA
jgi:deoxycytidine triphosphate deaminase